MPKEASSYIHILIFYVFALYGKWEKGGIEQDLIDLSTFTSPTFAWYFLVPSRLTAPGFPPSMWRMKLSHLVHTVPARSHGTLTLTGPSISLEDITMAVRSYEIYLWVKCCLSEYCFYYFLFIMWMKLCKLNQASNQCEKRDGKKKEKTRARFHLGLAVPNLFKIWKYLVCWFLVRCWHPY